jgi:hypothetical protein
VRVVGWRCISVGSRTRCKVDALPSNTTREAFWVSGFEGEGEVEASDEIALSWSCSNEAITILASTTSFPFSRTDVSWRNYCRTPSPYQLVDFSPLPTMFRPFIVWQRELIPDLSLDLPFILQSFLGLCQRSQGYPHCIPNTSESLVLISCGRPVIKKVLLVS